MSSKFFAMIMDNNVRATLVQKILGGKKDEKYQDDVFRILIDAFNAINYPCGDVEALSKPSLHLA